MKLISTKTKKTYRQWGLKMAKQSQFTFNNYNRTTYLACLKSNFSKKNVKFAMTQKSFLIGRFCKMLEQWIECHTKSLKTSLKILTL
jgi:hypothetical protein